MTNLPREHRNGCRPHSDLGVATLCLASVSGLSARPRQQGSPLADADPTCCCDVPRHFHRYWWRTECVARNGFGHH